MELVNAVLDDSIPSTGDPVAYLHSFYGCFFKDNTGIEMRDRIGIDRITFETDYPHTDSTWPDTRAIATKLLDGLDTDSIHKILRGNAIDLFELQGFA